MIDLLGTKARAEKRRKLQEAEALGAEGGKIIADALNRYMIARVQPSLEGALTEFKLRGKDAASLSELQEELAKFLEWLEEATEILSTESEQSLAEAFRYADVLSGKDHFRRVIRCRLSSDVGVIAMSAFDYAGVIADPLPRVQVRSEASKRIEDSILRIGVEEARARASLEMFSGD